MTDVNANETWGNGKDWACAPQREGGWVRLWPMKNKTYANNIEFGRDENMKDMIGQVSSVLRFIMFRHKFNRFMSWPSFICPKMLDVHQVIGISK